MIYNIADNTSSEEFLISFNKKFPRNTADEVNGITYYGFTAKTLPAVQDTLYDTLQNLNIGRADYVAVYYSRTEEPDVIKRQMIMGSDDLANNAEARISTTLLENTLQDLLSHNFVNS